LELVVASAAAAVVAAGKHNLQLCSNICQLHFKACTLAPPSLLPPLPLPLLLLLLLLLQVGGEHSLQLQLNERVVSVSWQELAQGPPLEPYHCAAAILTTQVSAYLACWCVCRASSNMRVTVRTAANQVQLQLAKKLHLCSKHVYSNAWGPRDPFWSPTTAQQPYSRPRCVAWHDLTCWLVCCVCPDV
jgi:hypothetical protein